MITLVNRFGQRRQAHPPAWPGLPLKLLHAGRLFAASERDPATYHEVSLPEVTETDLVEPEPQEAA